jgi:hypothetical protein
MERHRIPRNSIARVLATRQPSRSCVQRPRPFLSGPLFGWRPNASFLAQTGILGCLQWLATVMALPSLAMNSPSRLWPPTRIDFAEIDDHEGLITRGVTAAGSSKRRSRRRLERKKTAG